MLACQAYLAQLQKNPLRTKMLTSGSLAALQEVIASWIAKDVSKHGHYVNSRVPKMAVYGAFISAPLGHFLIHMLQKVFSGRTSLTAKIMQIVVSNLIVRLNNTDPPRIYKRANVESCPDCPNSELRLPRLHGCDRRRKDIPPGQGYRQSRLHASDEGQLDNLAFGSRLRPAVLARTYMGAILQHHFLCHRHLDQFADQEEEASSFEEKGNMTTTSKDYS